MFGGGGANPVFSDATEKKLYELTKLFLTGCRRTSKIMATDNTTTGLGGYLHFIFPQPCYDEYFVKFNFFHSKCFDAVFLRFSIYGLILAQCNV